LSGEKNQQKAQYFCFVCIEGVTRTGVCCRSDALFPLYEIQPCMSDLAKLSIPNHIIDLIMVDLDFDRESESATEEEINYAVE
jgi:hypothetical protein